MSDALKVAGYPFDDADADIILKSSRNTHFRSHRLMMTLISPVFKDMFSLPQSQLQSSISNDTVATSETPQTPIIDMPESTHDLRLLLEWCDPRASQPCPLPYESITTLLRLSDKYQIISIPPKILPHLLYHIVQPRHLGDMSFAYRSYLAACRFLSTPGLDECARHIAIEAAKQWVREHPDSPQSALTLPKPVPELDHVPAKYLYRLLDYRERRLNAAKEIVSDDLRRGWIAYEADWLVCTDECRTISESDDMDIEGYDDSFESYTIKTSRWDYSRGYERELYYDVQIREWFDRYLNAVAQKVSESTYPGLYGVPNLDVLLDKKFWEESVVSNVINVRVGKCRGMICWITWLSSIMHLSDAFNMP
jgi:hypothetical protein